MVVHIKNLTNATLLKISKYIDLILREIKSYTLLIRKSVVKEKETEKYYLWVIVEKLMKPNC